jgi:hypothetical protein
MQIGAAAEEDLAGLGIPDLEDPGLAWRLFVSAPKLGAALALVFHWPFAS